MGPVCESLVFHQACHGGSFFGARFVGVGIGVLLEPCDSYDEGRNDLRLFLLHYCHCSEGTFG